VFIWATRSGHGMGVVVSYRYRDGPVLDAGIAVFGHSQLEVGNSFHRCACAPDGDLPKSFVVGATEDSLADIACGQRA
jgi:hypothetical protein